MPGQVIRNLRPRRSLTEEIHKRQCVAIGKHRESIRHTRILYYRGKYQNTQVCSYAWRPRQVQISLSGKALTPHRTEPAYTSDRARSALEEMYAHHRLKVAPRSCRIVSGCCQESPRRSLHMVCRGTFSRGFWLPASVACLSNFGAETANNVGFLSRRGICYAHSTVHRCPPVRDLRRMTRVLFREL